MIPTNQLMLADTLGGTDRSCAPMTWNMMGLLLRSETPLHQLTDNDIMDTMIKTQLQLMEFSKLLPAHSLHDFFTDDGVSLSIFSASTVGEIPVIPIQANEQLQLDEISMINALRNKKTPVDGMLYKQQHEMTYNKEITEQKPLTTTNTKFTLKTEKNIKLILGEYELCNIIWAINKPSIHVDP